jgi:peptidoglycan hydrolase-like protein with peptidoglycan-binding domain
MADPVLYPWGYNTLLVPEERLWELARFDLMDPGTARRFKAYIRSKKGQMGIGGAVRFVQPDKPGFAKPGMSFHELQTFFDGKKNFAALDLVMRNGTSNHRSPNWSEVPKQGSGHPDIAAYGIHANVDGEPWHNQAIEMDGFTSWVNGGRKRPSLTFPIKDAVPVPPNPVIVPGSRTLRLTSPTMKGDDVWYLQNTLRKIGREITVDGDFGAKTEEHVKWYQSQHGLTSDGVVGPKTWAAVIADNTPQPPPPTDPNQPGSRTLKLTAPAMQGADVRFVQTVLRNQGITISIDSIYNASTRDKVKILQGWNNLDQDGVVGPQTWEAIFNY